MFTWNPGSGVKVPWDEHMPQLYHKWRVYLWVHIKRSQTYWIWLVKWGDSMGNYFLCFFLKKIALNLGLLHFLKTLKDSKSGPLYYFECGSDVRPTLGSLDPRILSMQLWEDPKYARARSEERGEHETRTRNYVSEVLIVHRVATPTFTITNYDRNS